MAFPTSYSSPYAVSTGGTAVDTDVNQYQPIVQNLETTVGTSGGTADPTGTHEQRLKYLEAGAGSASGTPSLTLSTTNSPGTAYGRLRVDATIAAFTTATPSTLSYGTAVVGTAATAARSDHGHAPFVGGSVATSGTVGFLYVPVTGGTPTGTPTILSGVGRGTAAAIIWDNVNLKLWAYGGTVSGWKAATFS